MRGTVPLMTWAGRRRSPYWRRIAREQAVVSMSARLTAAWEVVAAEVAAEEVEPEAMAAAVLAEESRVYR
jgi:hypothetical protein